MNNLNEVSDIAIPAILKAFDGVVDKSGNDYKLHLRAVAENAEGLYLQMYSKGEVERDNPLKYILVAYAHDYVEDEKGTYQNLRLLGFTEELIDGVDSVTRRKGESYKDFVVRAKANKIGRIVKLADIMDNTAIHRIFLTPETERNDLYRIKKYIYSYKFLSNELTEEEYLASL